VREVAVPLDGVPLVAGGGAGVFALHASGMFSAPMHSKGSRYFDTTVYYTNQFVTFWVSHRTVEFSSESSQSGSSPYGSSHRTDLVAERISDETEHLKRIPFLMDNG
jgi:hypothetical protein